jgi:hypothetical protein
MPRKVSRASKTRWPSRTYNYGFVFNRNGSAWFHRGEFRKSTSIRFNDENEEQLLKDLDAWLKKIEDGDEEVTRPDSAAPRTAFDLIAIFKRDQFPNDTPASRKHYLTASIPVH